MTLQQRLGLGFGSVLGLVVAAGLLVVWFNHRVDHPSADSSPQTETGVLDGDARAKQRLIDLFAITGVVVIGLATVVASRLTVHRLTDGMGELRRGASALSAGDLHYEVKLHGDDEFAELGTIFSDISRNLALARRQLTMANKELASRNVEITKQREISESLLRNILPGEIADELSAKGSVEPKQFEDVSILFTDFVGFTRSTEGMSADALVKILHEYFTDFDEIARRYRLEKLKTIGDSYMCAGGLPVRSTAHAVDTVLAALEMIHAVRTRARGQGTPGWSVRIGIHSGAVIAGVVGIDKFAFDVWGETVNFSSRIEATGAPNRINLSAATYDRVKEFFSRVPRGKVRTKEEREHDMYFVESVQPDLLTDRSEIPPPRFAQRYEATFGEPPPDFPAFLV